ncbi:MAG: hypothetical protein KDA81_10980 [Planctomycetaceae bacterium]|nr:hypothetical protein [Planctomycetaceae bacterium]
MAKKSASRSNPAAEFGRALLARLAERRDSSADYPCRLIEVAQDVQADISNEDLLAFAGVAPLKTKVVPAFSDDMESLVVLKEDMERLAASETLLRSLLQKQCSPQVPHVPLPALKTLLNKPVQSAFFRHWTNRIREQQLPDFVGLVQVAAEKGRPKPELHDRQFPLPHVERSEHLLKTLQQLLESSDAKFISDRQLFDAASVAADDSVTQSALTTEPFLSQTKVLRISESSRWLTLLNLVDEVLISEPFFLSLLHEVCSADSPETRLSALRRMLVKDLQMPFAAHWMALGQSSESLPGTQLLKVSKSDLVLRDARFPRPEDVLSQKLRDCLTEAAAQNSAENPTYPVRWDELLRKTGVAESEPSLLNAARKKAPFADDASVVRIQQDSEWFVQTCDAESMLGSESFLGQLLHDGCTAESPEVRLSELKKQLPRPLQARFSDIWRTHAELRHTFAIADLSISGRNDVLFRDARFPRLEATLSKRLVDTLESMKAANDGSYPCTFRQLLQRAQPDAGVLVANSAVMVEPYRSRIVTAFPSSAESPIAFLEDAEQVAHSPLLLTAVLSSLLKPEDQAVTIAAIAGANGLHSLVAPHVTTAIENMITARQLPPGLSALQIRKKWHLFRTTDAIKAADAD